MSDYTSAQLFGNIFRRLAQNPTDEHKEIAKDFFEQSMKYDFCHYQMHADGALISLGLARVDLQSKEVVYNEV